MVFFYSEKISYFSLVTDTIYIFTVAKQGAFSILGLVYFYKRFYQNDVCEK